jgi:hypothetical protein
MEGLVKNCEIIVASSPLARRRSKIAYWLRDDEFAPCGKVQEFLVFGVILFVVPTHIPDKNHQNAVTRFTFSALRESSALVQEPLNKNLQNVVASSAPWPPGPRKSLLGCHLAILSLRDIEKRGRVDGSVAVGLSGKGLG